MSTSATAWADGAGMVSDIAQAIQHASDGDLIKAGVSAGMSVLDALSYASDPLGSLLGCSAGWLIEHLAFLRHPLDLLAGDPVAIRQQSATWSDIAAALTRITGDYRRAIADDTGQWSGLAAAAYQTDTRRIAESLSAFASAAQGLAAMIDLAGTLVATERGIIRDMISTFVGKVAERAVIAAAASWCTAGMSVAGFIADAVAEGSVLASRCATRIAALLDRLAELVKKLRYLGEKFDQLSTMLSRGIGGASTRLEQWSSAAQTYAGHVAAIKNNFQADIGCAALHARDLVEKVSGAPVVNSVATGQPWALFLHETAGQTLQKFNYPSRWANWKTQNTGAAMPALE